MGHEWILDVLRDLSSYARANGLTALASKADEALRVARAEIETAGQQPVGDAGGMVAKGKAH